MRAVRRAKSLDRKTCALPADILLSKPRMVFMLTSRPWQTVIGK